MYSRTPDRVSVSHTPIPALKIKKNSRTLATRQSVTSMLCLKDVTMSHLSVFRIFWKSFSSFSNINEVFSGEQENEFIIRMRIG